MREWIRSRLTYANVMSTLAVFLVIGGGTALASYVISSNADVGPNTISGHRTYTGLHSNIITGSINGQDVANNSVAGVDIADNSGVDTCDPPLTARYGSLCVGSNGSKKAWHSAVDYCGGYGLRLPTPSEAITLAETYDVPGVSGDPNAGERFWTDDYYQYDATVYGEDDRVITMDEYGSIYYNQPGQLEQVVCVADPTN